MKASLQSTRTELTHGLRASQSALIEAAGKTHAIHIASLCYELARQRGRFAAALEEPGEETESENADESPLVSLIHGLALRVRAVLSHGDTYALLGDLIRSEDALIDQYRRTVLQSAGIPLAQELRTQFSEVSAARARLIELREKHTPAEFHASGQNPLRNAGTGIDDGS